MNPRIERDREMIVEARKQGKGALAGVFLRLSGPGWLQSAITLGGGSLSSSMYLGMLGGFAFLWLQPLEDTERRERLWQRIISGDRPERF